MSDERDKVFTAPPPAGNGSADVSASTGAGQGPADLLDLVRSAEEAATMPAAERASRTDDLVKASDRPAPEEFVDVGDDAVDAPPSLPPRSPIGAVALESPGPAPAFEPPSSTAPTPHASSPPTSGITSRKIRPAEVPASGPRGGTPPALGILLLLALALGALVAVTR